MSTITYPHISINPQVCDGAPCITGHRIRVFDVAVAHELHGLSPEEICTQYPGLTLAEVHAALAYFYDHREAILAELEAEQKAIRQYRQQHPDRVR